jgi:hypothetical protein
MEDGGHEEDADVDEETGEMDVVVEGTDNEDTDAGKRLEASDKGEGDDETEDNGLSRKS